MSAEMWRELCQCVWQCLPELFLVADCDRLGSLVQRLPNTLVETSADQDRGVWMAEAVSADNQHFNTAAKCNNLPCMLLVVFLHVTSKCTLFSSGHVV